MELLELSGIEVLERAALDAIDAVLRAGRRLIIAYSGGKDSTTILLLALNAARALREQGLPVPPILISHGDTGIENPLVAALVRRELVKAVGYGRRHGFEARADIATPLLNDTWAVAVLSGRKIPTFSNAGSRDCTVMFKIDPMTRLRNRVLKQDKKAASDERAVTLIGTRFEESDGRAVRMNARGETSYTPWEKDGQCFMSVIANWDMGDVWTFLALFRDGNRAGFTDARDVFDMYASATDDNTCAVVGDMASESTKKSRACGARFGCSLCAAVGRDKSLEALLNHPENAWMRPLNMIQRFIVDTQGDWSRRTWLGRTLTDGHIAIVPDTYSPAMLAELLRYCLSADVDEARASRRLGIAPRFELVSPEQLLAIDALWSMNGIQARPFAAVAIWDEIYNKRQRFYPSEVTPVPATPIPAARYLAVGADWDADQPGMFNGFRSAMHEAFGGAGCVGTRDLGDGRAVIDASVAPSFSFDPEAVSLFFGFEMEYVLRNFHDNPHCRGRAAFMHYCTLGMLATSNGHVSEHVDRILRRTAWRERQGLVGVVDVQALLAKTIGKVEMKALLETQRAAPPVDSAVEPPAAPAAPALASALQVPAAARQMDLWPAQEELAEAA